MQDANTEQTQPTETKADTFDREYVEQLRRENAKYRTERNQVSSQLSEVQKKAEEYDAILRKQSEEQGKYKELYESALKQVEGLKRYENRVSSLESVFSTELENLMKGMDEGRAKLINDLPTEMGVEQRLKWAKELIGAKQTANASGDLKSGGEAMQTAESVAKDYATADPRKRMEILFAIEKTNPTLYNALIKL